jgi:methylated-DNA-[protein]-cysteine S-methyltransferase
MSGSCRFGLWFVHVWWAGDLVFRVVFSRSPLSGNVPPSFIRYCAGKEEDFLHQESVATTYPTIFGQIYQEVAKVPYGETSTYGEIAGKISTSPRVVGQAMRRNPTPLVIPCHRVVGKNGIGGFTPSPEIKEALLMMEKKAKQRKKQ